jgi:ankyrin repeat protein
MNDLFKACKNGDFDLVKSLLDKGSNPNEDDYTPLDVAIENKHSKIANLLIEKGSQNSIKNKIFISL